MKTRDKRQAPSHLQHFDTHSSLARILKKSKTDLPKEELTDSLTAIDSPSETEAVFYDPAIPTDMKALEESSKIKMLGGEEEKSSWPVLVFNSKADYGFGLVAKRFIRAGEIIAPYLGELYTSDDDKPLAKELQEYAYKCDHNRYILAHQCASVAAFANHSFSIPNVYCVKKNDQLIYKAYTDIPAGSALFLDYERGYIFQTAPRYLSPYQNGKSPANKLKQYKEFYDTRTIKLTTRLKSSLNIDSRNANYLIVPKIFWDPDLLNDPEFRIHIHLPVFLAHVDEKTTLLSEQNQPYISSLMLACALREIKTARKLLEYGVDVFAETINNTSVLKVVTHMFSLNRKEKAFKDIYFTILAKIHKKYSESYTTKEIENVFVSYIQKHVNDLSAMSLIAARYEKYSFKKLKKPKLIAPASPVVEVKTNVTTPEVTKPSEPVKEQKINSIPQEENQSTKISRKKIVYTLPLPKKLKVPELNALEELGLQTLLSLFFNRNTHPDARLPYEIISTSQVTNTLKRGL